MQLPVPESFLLQIQLTTQVSPSWRSKQAIHPLLCAAVSLESAWLLLFAFSLMVSASAFYFSFIPGEKYEKFVQILVSKRWRTKLIFTWCKSKTVKDYSCWIHATRPALLYSSWAAYCLSTSLGDKAFQARHGKRDQESTLSYAVVFRSQAPKYKIKFRLLLRLNIWWSHHILFSLLSFL